VSIPSSDCVFVALIVQNAKLVCPIVLSSVACLALPNFSTSSHTWHDFQKKVVEHNIYVLILLQLLLKHFSF
jgi:hypothetical protein